MPMRYMQKSDIDYCFMRKQIVISFFIKNLIKKVTNIEKIKSL
jgi:hypothetical protein